MKTGKTGRILSLIFATGMLCLCRPRQIGLGVRSSTHASNSDQLGGPYTPTSPESLLQEANRLAWLSNWPRSEALYSRAEALFHKRGDARLETYARVGRIWSHSETAPFIDASMMLARLSHSAVVEGDPKLKLFCLTAKGYADFEADVPSAERAWTEARRIATRLGETGWEARLTGELGIVAFLQGDSRRASEMVGKALLSAMASGDVGTRVRDLGMLGNGFSEVKRYPEAIGFYDRAINLAKGTPGSGFPFLAQGGKARALIRQGKLGEATSLLEEALTRARQEGNLRQEAKLLILLGEGAMQRQDRVLAIHYLEQAGQIGRKYGMFDPVAQAMFDLTTLYRESGDLKSAAKHAAIGVDASRRVGSRYFLPRDLTVLADLNVLMGNSAKADHLYEQAEDVIEGMLNNLAGSYWSSSLADAMSATYLHHFELSVRSKQVERALGILERVRGRTATDALEHPVSLSSGRRPEVQILEDKVSTLQLRLMHSNDPGVRATTKEQLIEDERRLEWTRGAEGASPGHEVARPFSISRIQSILHADELILEYVLDEPRAYCVWIAKTDAGIEVLPAGKQQIEDLTRRYLAEMWAKRDADGLARQLSDMLLRPIVRASSATQLVVVPDGMLHLLPFDTLREPNDDLLIESRTISYVPASSVLQALRTRNESVTGRQFLGVGDVAYQNQGGVSPELPATKGIRGRILRGFADLFGVPLYDLPHTREEVIEASKIAGKDAVLLLGADATEARFKSEPLADFKVIHLAVHGFADTQFPERSGLVLGVDANSAEDGLLQVREILGLRFNADLVTLSACDTGIGRIQGEEGITNLPEAFLVSGAKAVVASLWNADDTYTGALMERFYAHIAERQGKAAALRQAKLEMLRDYGKRLAPYYWGGFVLVGDGASPISLNVH